MWERVGAVGEVNRMGTVRGNLELVYALVSLEVVVKVMVQVSSFLDLAGEVPRQVDLLSCLTHTSCQLKEAGEKFIGQTVVIDVGSISPDSVRRLFTSPFRPAQH